MLTALKKVALAGLGMKQRAQKAFETLVKEGEEGQGEDARRLRACLDLAQRGKEELKQKGADIRRRVSCIIPTRADLERIEKKLDDLASQKGRE